LLKIWWRASPLAAYLSAPPTPGRHRQERAARSPGTARTVRASTRSTSARRSPRRPDRFHDVVSSAALPQELRVLCDIDVRTTTRQPLDTCRLRATGTVLLGTTTTRTRGGTGGSFKMAARAGSESAKRRHTAVSGAESRASDCGGCCAYAMIHVAAPAHRVRARAVVREARRTRCRVTSSASPVVIGIPPLGGWRSLGGL